MEGRQQGRGGVWTATVLSSSWSGACAAWQECARFHFELNSCHFLRHSLGNCGFADLRGLKRWKPVQKATLLFLLWKLAEGLLPLYCVRLHGKAEPESGPGCCPGPLPTDPDVQKQKKSFPATLWVGETKTLSFQMGTSSLHTPPVLDAVRFAESNIQRWINVSGKMPWAATRGMNTRHLLSR